MKPRRLAPALVRRPPHEAESTGIDAPRQSLSDLIEDRLSSAGGRADLVKLATRLIVEEALEAESRDALGREY